MCSNGGRAKKFKIVGNDVELVNMSSVRCMHSSTISVKYHVADGCHTDVMFPLLTTFARGHSLVMLLNLTTLKPGGRVTISVNLKIAVHGFFAKSHEGKILRHYDVGKVLL